MNSNGEFSCFDLYAVQPLPRLDNSYQCVMDGYNDRRTARVAEVLCDFREIQLLISSVPLDPPNQEDYYTEGWSILRQCAADGHFILECAADTSVAVTPYGPAEVEKAELQQVMLDAYARRHACQKIVLRQRAVQRWATARHNVLRGLRPSASSYPVLAVLDDQLRSEIGQLTDEAVYNELLASDMAQGRWTLEDPSLQRVVQWLWARK
ncbi:hypothetical protein Golomagni_06326 [Golovinomyces magnicellulatus]|nr:hypothetical protein Golomagni_06326 [Golovinomyces magnicellulatus]